MSELIFSGGILGWRLCLLQMVPPCLRGGEATFERAASSAELIRDGAVPAHSIDANLAVIDDFAGQKAYHFRQDYLEDLRSGQ